MSSGSLETAITNVCMFVCMYDMVILACFNSKTTVTSVLMKLMLCQREKSLVGNRRPSP